jgi:hypothetical protein
LVSPAKLVPLQGRTAPLDPDAHRQAKASGRRAIFSSPFSPRVDSVEEEEKQK